MDFSHSASVGWNWRPMQPADRSVELHFSFSLDPRVRHTFWTQTVGYSAVYIGMLSSNQMMVQRYMSVSSVRRAQVYVPLQKSTIVNYRKKL